MSIIILLILTFSKKEFSKKFSPARKIVFWVFISILLLLTWVGANPVEPPFVVTGQVLTTVYFMLYTLL